MRKVLSVLICIIMTLSLLAVGVAAEGEPTVITTADQFAAMEADGNYKLGADIAITASYATFNGTFDGDGHTVTVSAPMFERITGTVKNLVIEGEVTGTGTSEHVAPLALRGSGTGIVISNITNKAKVTTAYRAAGIISQIDNNAVAVIENCTNYGDVTNTGEASSMLGGIIGYQQGTTLTIVNCVNYGKITSAYGLAGGIMGRFGGDYAYSADRSVTIKNCLNAGDVTATTQTAGILAYGLGSNVTIENCTNSATIFETYRSGGSQGSSQACGIFGATQSKDGYYCIVNISKCLNEGDITSVNGHGGGIAGYVWCGSYNGTYMYAVLTDCVNTGMVKGGSFASQFLTYTNDTKNMDGAKQPTTVTGVGLGNVGRAAEATRTEDKFYASFVGLSSSDKAANYNVDVKVANTDSSTYFAYSEGTEANRVPIADAPAGYQIVTVEAAQAAKAAIAQLGYQAPAAPSQGGDNPTTGDAAVWFAIAGAVALLGVAVTVKVCKSR